MIQATHAFRKSYNKTEVQELICLRMMLLPGSIGARQESILSCSGGGLHVYPFVWSTLLDQLLLQRIFARLPFPKINQLRSLSKPWYQIITSEEGVESLETCKKAFSTWYSFPYLVGEEHGFTMSARDAGLVCIVSAAIKKDLDYFLHIVI